MRYGGDGVDDDESGNNGEDGDGDDDDDDGDDDNSHHVHCFHDLLHGKARPRSPCHVHLMGWVVRASHFSSLLPLKCAKRVPHQNPFHFLPGAPSNPISLVEI